MTVGDLIDMLAQHNLTDVVYVGTSDAIARAGSVENDCFDTSEGPAVLIECEPDTTTVTGRLVHDRDAIRDQATAAEREACAQLAERRAAESPDYWGTRLMRFADLIRARGTQ